MAPPRPRGPATSSARRGSATSRPSRRCEQAGYEASARAPAAAARWFRAALHLLPEGTPSQERLELLLALAVALGSAGHLQDSREAFHEALALLPADSPAKGAAITGAAMIDHLLGQHDQAQSLLLESLAEARRPLRTGCRAEGRARRRQLLQRRLDGHALLGRGGPRGCPSTPPRCPPAGRPCSHSPTTGCARSKRPAPRPPRRPRSPMSSPTRSGPGSCSRCARSAGPSTASGACSWPPKHMTRAHKVANATGQQHLLGVILTVLANTNLALGRLALASEQAENAIDSSLLSANNLFLTWALTMRCTVEIERGSPAAAVRYGMRALEAGDQEPQPVVERGQPVPRRSAAGGRRTGAVPPPAAGRPEHAAAAAVPLLRRPGIRTSDPRRTRPRATRRRRALGQPGEGPGGQDRPADADRPGPARARRCCC